MNTRVVYLYVNSTTIKMSIAEGMRNARVEAQRTYPLESGSTGGIHSSLELLNKEIWLKYILLMQVLILTKFYQFSFLYIYICLSIYMSTFQSVNLSICLSVYLSICLSVYQSICLSVYLSICLSVYLTYFLTDGNQFENPSAVMYMGLATMTAMTQAININRLVVNTFLRLLKYLYLGM